MKTVISFLILIGILVSYFVLSPKFGALPGFSVAYYLAGLLVLAVMMRRVVKQYSHLGLALNLAGWCAFGLFMWWALSLSEYGEQPGIELGTVSGVQNMVLRDSSGRPFDMGEELASHKMTLLVFYRGYW